MTTEALDKVRAARAEAFEAKQELEARIEATRARITQICRQGTLPFDEAFSAWRRSFEAYADRGATRLHNNLDDFGRPNSAHPITGATSSLRHGADHPFEHDAGAMFAHVHRAAIIEEARQWFEEKCKGSNVPPAAEREAEAGRLADELRALEAERDAIQDQLADLFQAEPSERTRQARRDAEQGRLVDSLNEQAAARHGLA